MVALGATMMMIASTGAKTMMSKQDKHKDWSREKFEKNCDHFMYLVLSDANGTTRCSNCWEPLTDSQLRMMAQKGLVLCEELQKQESELT